MSIISGKTKEGRMVALAVMSAGLTVAVIYIVILDYRENCYETKEKEW